jgi:hypothetical protein
MNINMPMVEYRYLRGGRPYGGTAVGVAAGYLIGAGANDNEEYQIKYECIEPHWYRKYIFFSDRTNQSDVYAIQTNWVVKHDNLIRSYLINQNMHVYDSNPLEQCGYIQNKDYDWGNGDSVLFKGNRTAVLDMTARYATMQSTSLEWALIFSWIWAPFGILVLAAVGSCIHAAIYDKPIKSSAESPPYYVRQHRV